MELYTKTFNLWNEEERAYVFYDNMTYEQFKEWQNGLLNTCVFTNTAHPELMHVLFVDDEERTMHEKYVYQKLDGTLLRLLSA